MIKGQEYLGLFMPALHFSLDGALLQKVCKEDYT